MSERITYTFALVSESRMAEVGRGERSKLYLLPCAGDWYGAMPPALVSRRMTLAERRWRGAEEARPRHIVLHNLFCDGARVYTDLASPVWHCMLPGDGRLPVDPYHDELIVADFPARLMGWLKKKRGRWHIVEAGQWRPITRDEGQIRREYWQRFSLSVDGDVLEQTTGRTARQQPVPRWVVPIR